MIDDFPDLEVVEDSMEALVFERELLEEARVADSRFFAPPTFGDLNLPFESRSTEGVASSDFGPIEAPFLAEVRILGL